EPGRQRMQQEAANELVGGQRHGFGPLFMFVVFPAERDLATFACVPHLAWLASVDWRSRPDGCSGPSIPKRAAALQMEAWHRRPTARAQTHSASRTGWR